MDALNSTASRKLTPGQSMRNLEKAIVMADQRIQMRKTANARVSLMMSAGAIIPLTTYLIYNFFAPRGVMQNYKASTGAYGYWAMNFLNSPKSMTAMFRPEIDFKEQGSSLAIYSKRIEEKRARGELQEGVHYPSSWH